MDIKQIVKAYPTRYSLEYKKFPSYHRIKRLEKVASLVEGKTLLDAGCSDGLFLKIVRELRPDMELSGMDYDRDAIDYAKTLSDLDLRYGNVESLPYENETFDTVVCMETLEHVNNLEKAVDEIIRVLKPTGKAIITIPIETGLIGTLKRIGRKILRREDTHEHFDEKILENYLSTKIIYTWRAPFGLGKLYVVKK